jgi:NADPH:quinone reductase-like Zn-dependent oxidoreductase
LFSERCAVNGHASDKFRLETGAIGMSQVVRIHETGGPEVLRIEDIDVGNPATGELRVHIEALGLNRSEAMFRAGKYLIPPKLPARMGYEAAGVVDVVGDTVRGFAPGDRVCVLPTYRLGEYGVYGEKAIVPAQSVIKAPPELTPVEAASVWMQFLTALAIIEVANVGIGDYVLIPAASSSVGLAAIQLANWAGAVSIALTRRSSKAEALRTHGAAHVIATEESDVVAEVMRISGGLGARVVFDPVGGPFVEKLANAMATPFPHWPAALKGLSIRGWVAASIWRKPERFEWAQRLILRGLAGGQLKPIVSKVFPLGQIADAHRYLESNQQIGKIVVTV